MGAVQRRPAPPTSPALTRESRRALELLVAQPAATALCCDFDGSIASIVADPSTAQPLPGAVELLHALAGELGTVVVVSGRPGAFLADRLEMATRASPLRAFGLYGLEEVGPSGTVTSPPSLERWRPVLRDAATEARRAAPDAFVEDKGLAVTLHWRRAPAAAGAARAVAEDFATRYGLDLREGKMSVELFPPGASDKAGVVAAVAAGRRAVAYLGDDLGDLAAYDALDRLDRSGDVRTVRLGVDGPEAPPELVGRADVVFADPAAALEFLAALLRACRAR